MQQSYEVSRPSLLRRALEWWPVAIIIGGAVLNVALIAGLLWGLVHVMRIFK
jgi:hypothetical protein